MTFQNDEGEVLDFDGDFAITKQAVSFFNSKIKGDVSINFNVDNNSINRKVLGYDGPQMLNQVAFTRQPFTLMRNGNPFAKGFIVIQQDLGKELDCYFISGNSNWINLLNGLITELDYSGVTNVVNYEMQYTGANVLAGMSASSGVIFPMVDWCYDMNKGGNHWLAINLLDDKRDPYQGFTEFYPCFYLKTLVSEIVKQNGLKITGNILDDKLYQTLALTPYNGEMRRDKVNVTSAYGTPQTNATAAFVQYANLTESSDPDGAFSAAQYTAVRSSKVIITLTLVTVAMVGLPGSGQVRLRKNGATLATYTVFTGNTGALVLETSCVAGDILDIAFADGGSTSITLTANIKFDIPVVITIDDYFTPDMFLPPFPCLDVIKFAINFFGCVVYYDEYSKTLNINIVEKLKEEDAPDWSQYVQSVKFNYTQAAANNYMRMEDSEDTLVKAYNKSHRVKYGEGNIVTDNTIKDEDELIKIPFAATEFGLAKNGDWLSNIPLISLTDMEPLVYTAVADAGGLASYSFIGDIVLSAGQVMRIVDDTTGDIGIYVVQNFTPGTPNTVDFEELAYQGATSTGKLYPQQRTVNTITPRLLVVKPETAFADISSTVTSYTFRSSDTGFSSQTHTGIGNFCKSVTGENIDTLKANAAFDNPDIDTFTDPSVKELYFRKVSRLLGNPTIPVMMLLPEAEYQAFEFGTFIQLKTQGLVGYFWIESINHYRDSNTPVEIKLLML